MHSRFNLPGKIAWATMEAPGMMVLMYIMFTLPQKRGIEKLPMGNWLMAALFVCFQSARISDLVSVLTMRSN